MSASTPGHLRGVSGSSLDAVLSAVDASTDAGDELGTQLFGVVATLDASPALRRVLTDPSTEDEAKRGLASTVFGAAVSAATIEVVRTAVGGRWSAGRDLTDGLETAGVVAILKGAADAGQVDTLEDELFSVANLVTSTPELRSALSDTTVPGTGKSELVGAMKTYAYMDQGALVEVDVREGLEATLTILAHKLKATSITVIRDYGDELPRVCVYGSELNQVWTNLLDNAIGALGETGTITVSTRPWDGDGVEVVIADDGPGIPAELQRQVFDPFFTTKGVGEGTGMGLDVARRIVEDRHQGRMVLESEPGRTAFMVRLPRAPRRADG